MNESSTFDEKDHNYETRAATYCSCMIDMKKEDAQFMVIIQSSTKHGNTESVKGKEIMTDKGTGTLE